MKYRTLIFSAVVPLLLSGLALAQPPDYAKRSAAGIVRIQNSGEYKEAKIAVAWGDHIQPPSNCSQSIINLRDAMLTWTKVPVAITGQVRLSSPDINKLPILFISTEGPAELSATEESNLREYIKNGGFVMADGNMSVLQMVRNIAGNKHLEYIPASHAIYQTPFLTGGPIRERENVPMQTEPGGRMLLTDEARGLLGYFIDGRLAMVYSPTRYYVGWQRNNDAYLKFGVNLIMYAITGG